MEVLAHGLAGNFHAMDAVLRLPPEKLVGVLLDAREALGTVFMPMRKAFDLWPVVLVCAQTGQFKFT